MQVETYRIGLDSTWSLRTNALDGQGGGIENDRWGSTCGGAGWRRGRVPPKGRTRDLKS